MTLERAGTLRGKVIGEDGNPLADVWVSAAAAGEKGEDAWQLAMRRGFMLAQNRVLTDDEGGFQLVGLDPSARYDVKAEQAEGASVVVAAVSVADNVIITVAAPGSVEGLVTDACGRAIEDFTLRVLEANTQRSETREVINASGRFKPSGITPGKPEIHAIEPTGQAAQLHAELKAGQKLAGLRLALAN